MRSNSSESESEERSLLSRVIKAPGAISAQARAVELMEQVVAKRQGATAIIYELENEVESMKIPERHEDETTRLVKTSQTAEGLSPSEHKRKQLLIALKSLKSRISLLGTGGDLVRTLYELENIVLDIEATKTQDQAQESEHYNLQGVNIELNNINQVFKPSPHGLFLAEHIHVNPGETVIDIGAGSGLFAILSSRLGGKAFATEITESAVEMIKTNAAINEEQVNVRQGSFFAGFEGKFDVLIANLPQKLILQKRPSKFFETRLLGVYGGNSGNEVLLDFLQQAKEHMHSSSRLYIQVYSLTDYNESLRQISKNYSARQLARKEFLEDEIILGNLEGYEELKRTGVIDIVYREGHWYTYETAYELRLLPSEADKSQ